MILIVDFGGQYTRLIERVMVELDVAVQVIDPEVVTQSPPETARGVILSGSPASVNDAGRLCAERILGSWNVPVLGICYGHQLLAAVSGGQVAPNTRREYGKAILTQLSPSPLWTDVQPQTQVWMSHGDSVVTLPNQWSVIGSTADGAHAAIASNGRRFPCFGVQFHPEVVQTVAGTQILRNFVFGVCEETADQTALGLQEQVITDIRQRVPTGDVLVACSMGVDSTTLVMAFMEALGRNRVLPLFINTGLLRDEDFECLEALQEHIVVFIEDAAGDFLGALQGVANPESKRLFIGQKFWEVFCRTALIMKHEFNITAFAQGTIAPDTIESGTTSAYSAVIKTHHNLVKPPANFPFSPCEPLRTLYKDQVRRLGHALKVPQRILHRHPFPGPGLAVRILGEVTPERLRIARQADAIFINALRQEGLYDHVSQALVCITADRAVGVKGDGRAYGHIAMLRAVVTRDFMTADVFHFPPGFIEDVSTDIANQVDGISHVVLSTTRKPPATVEFE